MTATDARILDEAAHWLARRHASDFSAHEQSELARWRRRSARHEQVWQQAEQLQARMGGLPPALGKAVLGRERPAQGRRQLLRTLACVLATPAAGWLAYAHLPWQRWGADYRTATGERRSITLADGSQVQLNTASAISVRMDGGVRRIYQHGGEILVETAHAPAYAGQPFIVHTPDGQMQALGTRFTVRRRDTGTTMAVLEGAVRVTPARAGLAVTVPAGMQIDFDGDGAQPLRTLAPHSHAWSQGVLYADRLRLQDFLAELGRYREGLLLCDPEVADLRISGIYQLADTDRVLQLLAQTSPVRIQQRSPYWVRVVPR